MFRGKVIRFPCKVKIIEEAADESEQARLWSRLSNQLA